MTPLPRFARLCDRQFVVHETYRLVVEDERVHDLDDRLTHRIRLAMEGFRPAIVELERQYGARVIAQRHHNEALTLNIGMRELVEVG